jgi:branched-chain amino acid transport system substrate-binding protein
MFALNVGTTAAAPEPTQTTVKVGLLTPQTGGLSAYTKGFEQAAELAITDLNKDASIPYTFELTKYDTKTDPTGATAAMTAAVTDGVAYVVGAAGSSNTLAAAAVAITNKVPLISYASTSPDLSSFNDHAVTGDAGYLWRTPPSDALQGQVIADIADDAGYTKMVIVTLDNSYGAGLAASTKAEFETLGGTATVITYSETAVDFSTVVTQIDSNSPDIVVAISYATDGSLLFVEMADQDLRIPVIGADGVADVGIFGETTGTQEAMQGFLTTKPSAAASAAATAFDAAYKAAFTNTTGDIYTGETYDAVFAGALAINASASTDGEEIIAALADLSWEAVTGTLTFDENGDSSAGYYQVSEVVDDSMDAVGSWTLTGGLVFTDTAFMTGWKTRNALEKTLPGGDDEGFLAFEYTPILAAMSIMAVYTIIRRRK